MYNWLEKKNLHFHIKTGVMRYYYEANNLCPLNKRLADEEKSA